MKKTGNQKSSRYNIREFDRALKNALTGALIKPDPVLTGLGTSLKDNPSSFDAWCQQVRRLVDGVAKEKSYTRAGVDGRNILYEFVRDTIGSDGHAIGEAIYKLRRFTATGNIEDIEKAAAWCWLIWKHAKQ